MTEIVASMCCNHVQIENFWNGQVWDNWDLKLRTAEFLWSQFRNNGASGDTCNHFTSNGNCDDLGVLCLEKEAKEDEGIEYCDARWTDYSSLQTSFNASPNGSVPDAW